MSPTFTFRFRSLLRPVLLAGATAFSALAPAQDDFIKQTTSLPAPRAFHGAAVLGDFLYVIGGSVVDAASKKEIPAAIVHVARINPDGTLTKFVPTTPIPSPRHYINNSTLVLNDTVYVIGGSSAVLNGTRTNTVAWTRPLANGMLEPWRESQPFAEAGASSAVALATPGYLHMIGGISGDKASSTVYSIKINPDGSLAKAWEVAPPLPSPRWFHGGAIAGGRAYIWGGLESPSQDNVVASNLIFSSEILVSGQLGQWRQETVTLPQGFYASSVAVAGPYLFSIAPRYDGRQQSTDIWWSIAGPQGIGAWSKRPSQLSAASYHAAATDYRRGIIYFPGGRPEKGGMTAVTSMIRLSNKAREQAEHQWAATEKAHLESVSTRDLGGNSPIAGAIAAVAPGAGATAAATPAGFVSFAEGQQASKAQKKPLIIYFRSARAKPCLDQDAKLTAGALAPLAAANVLAQVDVQVSPQLAQQYAVYRVPTWVAYGPDGREIRRTTGVQEIANLTALAK
ncbi:hypothetical protein BH09SUM1_BH09SUM1_24580 [soil metagenome]